MTTVRPAVARGSLAAALVTALLGCAHAPMAPASTTADAPEEEIIEYHVKTFMPDPSVAEYRVPLFMLRGHPAVIAHLPGSSEPLYFVVDTAAGLSVIDPEVAKRFKLETVADEVRGISGAGGNASNVGMVLAKNLTIGKLDVTADMLSMDMGFGSDDDGLGRTPIAGIIGLNVLRAFHVTFDLSRGELLLRSNADPEEHCTASLGLDGKKSSYITGDLTLPGGGKVRAVIDTGAAQTIFNWHAAKAIGVQPGDARLRKRVKGSRGIDKNAMDTWLFDLPGLQWNDWDMSAREIRISDLPVFEKLGLANRPAVIFGIDFLRDRRFTIAKDSAGFCLRSEQDK